MLGDIENLAQVYTPAESNKVTKQQEYLYIEILYFIENCNGIIQETVANFLGFINAPDQVHVLWQGQYLSVSCIRYFNEFDHYFTCPISINMRVCNTRKSEQVLSLDFCKVRVITDERYIRLADKSESVLDIYLIL